MTDHDPTPWDYEPLDCTIYDREGNKPVAFVECKRNVPILLAAPAMLAKLEDCLSAFRAFANAVGNRESYDQFANSIATVIAKANGESQ